VRPECSAPRTQQEVDAGEVRDGAAAEVAAARINRGLIGWDLLDHGGRKDPFIAILETGGTVMRDIRLASLLLTPLPTRALAAGVAGSAVFGACVPAAR